jgi:hypothetical protein
MIFRHYRLRCIRLFCHSAAVRLKVSIFSEGGPKVYAEFWAIQLTRARCDSAGLSRSLETIVAFRGRKNVNPDRKHYLGAISIRDLA